VTVYPFPLDPAELRDVETIPARILNKRFNEEYQPGHLKIDRARERRNPDYFADIFRTVLRLVPISRALDDLGLARQRLALVPNALREAFEFDWSPDGHEAQSACAVAVMLGERLLAAAAAVADGGFSVFEPDGTRVETTDLAACQHTRCLAALAAGDDESARREFAAMTAGIDNYAAASDRRLLSGHARLLAAILDRDEAELDDAARTLTTNLLDHITAQRYREQSRDLIDWPTTAALAVAMRRGMRIPTDLPTCAVDLIVPDWAD
jgi:hypothetical protein